MIPSRKTDIEEMDEKIREMAERVEAEKQRTREKQGEVQHAALTTTRLLRITRGREEQQQ